jgi:hypothetical protein
MRKSKTKTRTRKSGKSRKYGKSRNFKKIRGGAAMVRSERVPRDFSSEMLGEDFNKVDSLIDRISDLFYQREMDANFTPEKRRFLNKLGRDFNVGMRDGDIRRQTTFSEVNKIFEKVMTDILQDIYKNLDKGWFTRQEFNEIKQTFNDELHEIDPQPLQ